MRYDPRKHDALCHLCPRAGQVVVPPEGPKRAHICWLGQDPGKTEVKQLRPFVGATGTRLIALWEKGCELTKVVLPRRLVWVTNVCLCLPVTKSQSEGRRAADCCAPRLRRELEALHPGAGILAMGKWAFYALTGLLKGQGKFQGFHVPITKLPDLKEVKPVKPKKAKKK